MDILHIPLLFYSSLRVIREKCNEDFPNTISSNPLQSLVHSKLISSSANLLLVSYQLVMDFQTTLCTFPR